MVIQWFDLCGIKTSWTQKLGKLASIHPHPSSYIIISVSWKVRDQYDQSTQERDASASLSTLTIAMFRHAKNQYSHLIEGQDTSASLSDPHTQHFDMQRINTAIGYRSKTPPHPFTCLCNVLTDSACRKGQNCTVSSQEQIHHVQHHWTQFSMNSWHHQIKFRTNIPYHWISFSMTIQCHYLWSSTPI